MEKKRARSASAKRASLCSLALILTSNGSQFLVGIAWGGFIAVFVRVVLGLLLVVWPVVDDGSSTLHNVVSYPLAAMMVLACFVGPVVETLLFQFFIFEALLYVFRNIVLSLVFSSVLFSMGHLLYGAGMAQAVAALVAGSGLQLLYAIRRNNSRWSAVVVTAIAHAINNGVWVYQLVENNNG